MHDMTEFGISHTWNFWYWTLSAIRGCCQHLLVIYDALMLTSAVYVIKSQVLGLQRAFFRKKIQDSVVPRSIMTNMNYFEYQLCQPSNMPKLSHEKHEISLVPKMSCVSYNEQQLFQASNMPRSLKGTFYTERNREISNFVPSTYRSNISLHSVCSFEFLRTFWNLEWLLDTEAMRKNDF